jgi:2-dehydropantoate 2-reductase
VEVRQPDRGSDEDVTVGVLGPGAVGGALAVPLALAGARVVCIARPETAATIARDGITLLKQDEELHARVGATDALREPVDTLIVSVKAPGLDDALRRIDARADTVLPLLNGLEHMDVIRSRLGGNVVAGTIGLIEAYRESPTRIVQTTPGPVVTAAEPLRLPPFEVRVVPEKELLWDKVARMCALAAATSITKRPIGELRSDPEWRSRLQRAVDEAVAVANADGASITAASQWEIIDALAPTVTTSAARDIAAGRPSELDAITGAVVRAGHRLGISTPELDQLWEEACRLQSR